MNKIDLAIERLKIFEPKDGYYLAFSGGKDSVVIKHLAIMAGVKFDAHYNVTTIDPPELIYFIKEHHSDVVWNRPKMPFLSRMVEKGFPPLRHMRWCCKEYKERGGSGRTVVTGVRAQESKKRASRNMVDTCYSDNTRHFLHPIIDWTHDDVWNFIREHNLPYCKLYDEGWKRIGCLFCPNRYDKSKEILRYPKFFSAFQKAFERLYDKRKTGLTPLNKWKSGEEFFYWWLGDVSLKKTNIGGNQIMIPFNECTEDEIRVVFEHEVE